MLGIHARSSAILLSSLRAHEDIHQSAGRSHRSSCRDQQRMARKLTVGGGSAGSHQLE